MRRHRGTIFLVAAGLSCLTAAAEAGPVQDRQLRQGARIAAGWEDGSLTARETKSLVQQQRAVAARRRHVLADGVVRPGEAARLERAQNRASHHIYGLRHNGRTAR